MSEDLRISSKEPITPIPPPREGRLPSSLEAAIEQVLRTYPHDEQAFKVFEAIVKAAPTDDLRKGLRLLDEKRTGVDDPPGSGWAIEQMRDIIITELQNRGIDPYPAGPPLVRADAVAVHMPAAGVAAAELPLDGVSEEAKANLERLNSKEDGPGKQYSYGWMIQSKLEKPLEDDETEASRIKQIKQTLTRAADDKRLSQSDRQAALRWLHDINENMDLAEAARVFERE